jgi:hypothetical protein
VTGKSSGLTILTVCREVGERCPGTGKLKHGVAAKGETCGTDPPPIDPWTEAIVGEDVIKRRSQILSA